MSDTSHPVTDASAEPQPASRASRRKLPRVATAAWSVFRRWWWAPPLAAAAWLITVIGTVGSISLELSVLSEFWLPMLIAVTVTALVAVTRSMRRRAARRRLEQVPPPTAEHIATLPADRRLELGLLQQQARLQTLNSLGILLGVLFTADSPIATALTLQSTQQGQIIDRYTKAVEQLGSTKREVRTAAIYALERIAKDSERDRLAIRDVLAAFIREHDPAPKVKADALTVLGRRPTDPWMLGSSTCKASEHPE